MRQWVARGSIQFYKLVPQTEQQRAHAALSREKFIATGPVSLVSTGPLSPSPMACLTYLVSTGPLFPLPMACLASPNRANAQGTPMARTQRGDCMLKLNTSWL